MSLKSVDLTYVPSPDTTIFLNKGEAFFSTGTVRDVDITIPTEICSDFKKVSVPMPIGSNLFNKDGTIDNLFKDADGSYFIMESPGRARPDILRAWIQVVPKSFLHRVENCWKSLIGGTKGLIQSHLSTLNSIFYLNVLGVGLIAASAIGLYYIKPEDTKNRLRLQILFIAGLASVVFATFKANSSIDALQKF